MAYAGLGDEMGRGYYQNLELEQKGGENIPEQTRNAVRSVLGEPIDNSVTADSPLQVLGIAPMTIDEVPGIYKHEVKFCLSRMSLFPIVIYGDKRFVLNWGKIRDLAEIAGLFDEPDSNVNEDVGL